MGTGISKPSCSVTSRYWLRAAIRLSAGVCVVQGLVLLIDAASWPLRAMAASTGSTAADWGLARYDLTAQLVTTVTWIGLGIAAAALSSRVARWVFPEASECLVCGYDCRGLERCPECGGSTAAHKRD